MQQLLVDEGAEAAYCAASLSEDLVGLHVVGGANTDCTSLSALAIKQLAGDEANCYGFFLLQWRW